MIWWRLWIGTEHCWITIQLHVLEEYNYDSHLIIYYFLREGCAKII